MVLLRLRCDAYVISIGAMDLVHPGRILVGPDSEFPKGKSWKEKREAKRARKEEAKVEEGAEKGSK